MSQMLLHTQDYPIRETRMFHPSRVGSSSVSLKPEEPRCPAAKAHGWGPGWWDHAEVAGHSLPIPSLRTATVLDFFPIHPGFFPK